MVRLDLYVISVLFLLVGSIATAVGLFCGIRSIIINDQFNQIVYFLILIIGLFSMGISQLCKE